MSTVSHNNFLAVARKFSSPGKSFLTGTVYLFKFIQNKFFINTEKLFASRTQAKQFACLRSRIKKGLRVQALFCTRDPN